MPEQLPKEENSKFKEVAIVMPPTSTPHGAMPTIAWQIPQPYRVQSQPSC